MRNYLIHFVERLGHWARLIVQPRLLAFRRRFAPQILWLQDRLSPQGYLGLHLTVGVLLLVGAAWLFGGITEDVLTGDPLTMVDRQVTMWLHEHATPWLTSIMWLFTFLGSTVSISAGGLLTAMFLLWKRRRHWFYCLLLTLPGGMLLNVLIKHVIHRARPSFDDPFLVLRSYSFPSGHTMATTLLCGLLAAFAFANLRSWRWRVLAVLLAFALILLVGLSRIYLGAHYLSDVLAATTAGIAWLAFCLIGVETLRRRRAHSSECEFADKS